MKKLLIFSLVLVVIPVLLFSSIGTALGASEYDPEDPGSGIVPDCNPFKFPSEGGCGVDDAYQLGRNIMKFLIYLIIPLAGLMIGWGGFLIMTAAGSSERVKRGTTAITIALTGIVIVGVSFLIIEFIFSTLSVEGVKIISS